MQNWKPLKYNLQNKIKQIFALSILQNSRPRLFFFSISLAFSPNNSDTSLRQCTHEGTFFCSFSASLLPDRGYTRKVLVAARLYGLLPPHSLFQVKDLPPRVSNSQKKWNCPCVLQGFLQILSLITPWTLLEHDVERKTLETDPHLQDVVLNLKTKLWGRAATSGLSPPQTAPHTKDLWVTPWSHTFWSLYTVSVTFLPLMSNVPTGKRSS